MGVRVPVEGREEDVEPPEEDEPDDELPPPDEGGVTGLEREQVAVVPPLEPVHDQR